MPTFTIVARCGRTGMFGAAIATKSIAVGSRCLFVEAGAGAVSSQAVTNPRLGRRGLERLREGRPADATMADVLATEAYPEKRQILLVDRSGGAAAHTGSANRAWAGHITRADVACGGNLLTSERVVTAMAETFEGGGFALLEGRVAVAGLCDRATQGALNDLGDFLLREQIVDQFIHLNMPKGLVHIDGEFAELPGKRAIAHRASLEENPATFRTRTEAWDGSFLEWLVDDDYDIIEITDQECNDMAANFLTVHSDLCIHYTGNPRVMQEVRERGIEVVQIPGDEMRRGCGGIHCMTCPVLRV